MLQSSVIEDLLRQMAAEPDEARRVELARAAKDRYFQDMEHQTNYVQKRVSDLEIVLQDQLTQSLGNTNDMVSGLVEDGREFRRSLKEYFAANTAAVEGLQTNMEAGFRDLTAIGERLTGVEATIAEHDRAIQSFRQSRDESQRERKEIRDDVAALAQHFADFRDEIRRLIEAARKPEEVDRLVSLIEKHEADYLARRGGDAERS